MQKEKQQSTKGSIDDKQRQKEQLERDITSFTSMKVFRSAASCMSPGWGTLAVVMTVFARGDVINSVRG